MLQSRCLTLLDKASGDRARAVRAVQREPQATVRVVNGKALDQA